MDEEDESSDDSSSTSSEESTIEQFTGNNLKIESSVHAVQGRSVYLLCCN